MNTRTERESSRDMAAERTVAILQDIFGEAGGHGVGVRLWNGQCWPDAATPPVTLVLKHPGALRTMLTGKGELALAEAYLHDDFDIEGDLESVFGLADALRDVTAGWRTKLRVAQLLSQLPGPPDRRGGIRGPVSLTGRRHSVERDRQGVAYHYDVSNEFYALWLDQRVVYSCAYFRSPDEDLDAAQEAKLDYICRKLRLRPGQRLLDVGCGWGGLVLHAAQRYGVDATGITLSQPQAEWANRRIAAAGVVDRARVQVRDYRQFSAEEASGFDALVSVGMFEHVGADKLGVYFTQAWRLLKPGGVFLNHGIARHALESPVYGHEFIDAYVFPDGELTPISATLGAAEAAGFELRDVESLREHYALTLRHWVRRLEAGHQRALEHVDEPTYRVWRLYMAGSAYGFAGGWLNLYQSLLAKPDAQGRSGLPLTRRDWYGA